MGGPNALFSRFTMDKRICLFQKSLAGSTAADRRSTDREGGELRGFCRVVEAFLEEGH
jgi:hypothetical protein